MPELVFPPRTAKAPAKRNLRNCAAHRAWVRRHSCSVRGCRGTPIECAHVRSGTDAGMGLKPSDRWAISLCLYHHREQHSLGETAFQEKYSMDLIQMAIEFARRSPHRLRLFQVDGSHHGQLGG